MAYIREEIEHEETNIVLQRLELTDDEIQDGEIIKLDCDDSQGRFSPDEIESLGTWLNIQANRIRDNYDKSGKIKEVK